MLKQRAALPPDDHSEDLICRAILAHPVYQNATTVLLYASVHGELDLTPVLTAALHVGKTVCYPRCEAGNTLDFCPIKTKDDLIAGKYGIPTPAPSIDPLFADALSGALCIVPALAADLRGYRLGYGGGYYDRFLATASVVSLCALRTSFLLPSLPTDAYDVPCDYLCTEKGVFPCA